jgi:hypothetical protein
MIHFMLLISRAECPTALAQSLAKLYPTNPKVSIVDGTCGDDWAAVCAQHGIDLVCGARLKPLEYGTAWMRRWIACALDRLDPGDLLIKLDADCRLLRAFALPPPADIAGHLACHRLNHQLFDRGGVTAYRHSALIKIQQSGLQFLPKFCDSRRFAYYNQGELLQSEAQTIAAIAHELGLQFEHWPEVHNAWREPLPIDDFAIVAGGI